MKKNIEMIKWKLCEGYFSIIESNLKDEITFDELIFVSKVSGKDAEKIISKNSKDYNFIFLRILISKLDTQTLNEFKIDINEDTVSNNYEKILEGLTLRFESFLPYRQSFKILSQRSDVKAQNFLRLLEKNCSFVSNLLDIVEGEQNQIQKTLKSIALNIVFLKAVNIFLAEKCNSLDSTIRFLDKDLRDFEDVGQMLGIVKN